MVMGRIFQPEITEIFFDPVRKMLTSSGEPKRRRVGGGGEVGD
jgi:hypothetical protein